MRIKTISFVVALVAGGTIWAGGAFAAGPASTCPASFQCGFSFAQTKSLGASNPGQPSVIIGYLSLDNSTPPIPTLVALSNEDGTLKTLQTITGTCANGTSGAPGTLDFTGVGGPKIAFVVSNSDTELKFVSTDVKSGFTNVSLGSCRQL